MSAIPTRFRIGGYIILVIPHNYPDVYITEAYKPFIVRDGKPSLTIKIHYGNIPDIALDEKIFSADTWRLYRTDDGFAFYLHSPVISPNDYALARIDLSFQSAEIFYSGYDGHTPYFPLESPLDQLILLSLLSKDSGMLIHACGINDGGRGYLFAGNSTHGKSTMASIWKDHATVLNDDRIVLRQRQDGFWMYGTPWHGDNTSVSPERVRIDKIFFLKHADSHKVTRKHGSAAASMLLARAFPPLWDRPGMAKILDFCAQLVAGIPCYQLDFLPDDSIIDFVRCVD